jgi:inner membrane protein
MPTIFTHAAFALGFSKLVLDYTDPASKPLSTNTSKDVVGSESIDSTAGQGATDSPATNRYILLTAGILAVLPDADALFLPWIAYQHALGHRGFSHSLVFALLIGLASALLLVKLRWNNRQSLRTLTILLALASASHGFFDAMTTGGLGVAFFSPFDNTRYFFPFRPIPVAPLSAAGLFTARGMNLLLWEFALLWTFAIGCLIWSRRKLTGKLVALICWLICLAMWAFKG